MVSEHRAPLAGDEEVKFVDFSAWRAFLSMHRSALAIAAGASFVIGVLCALLLPKSYTAHASILPSEAPSPWVSMISQLGGGALASRLLPPSQSIVMLYPDILKSRTILEEILTVPYKGGTIRSALLGEEDSTSERTAKEEAIRTEKLLKRLRKMLKIRINPETNFIVLEITHRDPELAAAILNEGIRKMDNLLQHRMKTEGRYVREMIEKRLMDERDSLRVAEERLLEFRESNRAISVSPEFQIIEMRLVRQVDIHNALYVELSRQLELAKIEELRTMPVVKVLDWAVAPSKPSGPSVPRVVLVVLIIGLVGTVLFLKARDAGWRIFGRKVAPVAQGSVPEQPAV